MAFQDGLVARKALLFTSESIYWNCREKSWCEDQYTEFLDVRNEPSADTSLFNTRLSRSTCDRSTGFTTQALCPMGLYAQHAQAYSQRLFSNYSDIVWVFLGILRDVREEFPKGYIRALPYDKLDAALLW